MSDSSLILALPYILPAQAQKHVTHNEALRTLDMIVQPTVLEMGRVTPPSAPAPGERYGVGAGAVGEWGGQDGALAVWESTGWSFVTPGVGWSTRSMDTLAQWVFDGSAWILPQANTSTLGINASADTTNRLSVSAPATLFSHEGADHQLKINKATDTDTASLLYQTGWAGRAEMGTTGSDDFEIKVSADGTTWQTGLTIAAGSGQVAFPSGARLPRRTEVSGPWTCYTDQRWVTFSRSAGMAGSAHDASGGTGAEPDLSWEDMGLFLPAGTVLDRLEGMVRAADNGAADLTGYSLRVYFQYGPSASEAEPWNANAQTTRDQIFATDSSPLTEGWRALLAPLANYTTPQDGHLVIYFKPEGTLSQSSALLSSLALVHTT
jgi:hypothetical protein